MGQYHYLVNFDRKEIVHPHKLGLGLKQGEHTGCPASLSDALYLLMTSSPASGGGDLPVDADIEHMFQSFGRWVGDRVAVFGDYTEIEPFCKISKMLGEDWDETCIHSYLDTFSDITERLTPAFGKAYGVSFTKHDGGYVSRQLDPHQWGWLFPSLLEDEKTA